VVRGERRRAERALAHAARFREAMRGIAEMGGSDSQIVPVILGSDGAALEAARGLCEAGFDVRAIRPPTVPAGTARLRLAFNATLETADVDRLIASARTVLERVAVGS